MTELTNTLKRGPELAVAVSRAPPARPRSQGGNAEFIGIIVVRVGGHRPWTAHSGGLNVIGHGRWRQWHRPVASEESLREALGADALPIVYDDPYPETICRIAMPDSPPLTGVWRVPSGTPLHYPCRSMFYITSNEMDLRRKADRARVIVMGLRRPGRGEPKPDWRQWQRDRKKFNDSAGRRLMARTGAWFRAGRMDRLLATMIGAATAALDSVRAGGQYGTLLSGAWTLQADAAPSDAEAAEWIGRMGFRPSVRPSVAQDQPEGMKVLIILLRAVETIDAGGERRAVSIARMIRRVADDPSSEGEDELPQETCRRTLLQCGIRVGLEPEKQVASALARDGGSAGQPAR